MGFTLRFILGLFLVLAICSSSKSASVGRRMKFLSQEPSTLVPVDKNDEITSSGNSNEEHEQKPKTDEINKISSAKEEDTEPVQYNPVKPISVTENDLSKELSESPKTTYSEPDLNINIDKYVSPEFHDKNNVYKQPTSPDIKKYINPDGETHLTSTSNYDFDKKHQTIKNDIKKKLSYIDEKFSKSSHQYEQTTENETPPQDLIKYKSTSYTSKDGNKVHKDDQEESGQNFEHASSYNHTVLDEQKHVSSSETVLDSDPKTNETEELKNKIFRAKTTVDPEVLHEKLNQTERRTALLSNKIEHDSTNENRRLKWSFHYTPTTVPYTTTTGQKEEIMFVPYTKEAPINISKRGSTKYIDTVTTQKATEQNQTKLLDEAAVENTIYPVQVPAPNSVSKEESTNGIATTVVPSTTSNAVMQNASSPETRVTHDNVTTEELTTETDTTVPAESTKMPEMTTLLTPEKTYEGHSTPVFTHKHGSEDTSPSTPMNVVEENSTLPTTSKPQMSSARTAVEEDTTLSSTPKQESSTPSTSSVVTYSNESATLGTLPVTQSKVNEEETTTTSEGMSTTGDYASDQTVSTVIANETTSKGVTVVPSSTTKNTEIVTSTPTMTTDTLPTTLNTSPTTHVEQKASLKDVVPIKAEDRTSSGRDLKNPTTLMPNITETYDTGMPIETTTVDYNDNVIKQGDISTTTTKHTRTDVPVIPEYTQNPPVVRKPQLNVGPDSSSNEDTTGSGYTNSDEQEDGITGGKIAAIVISCIGAMCFIILAILWFVMRKRHKRFNYGQRCTPVSLDAYSVDNVSAYNSVRRKGMMRASKRSYGNPAFEESSVTHLLNFPELMKFGTNAERIASEYEDIPQISVQTNELPEGCEIKNRYANVIPLPESRVFLSTIDECPNSDYINANFVTGPKSTKNYYIACQAPTQSTVDDFWRMIWEQQSRVILMLTHLFENGAEKCFDYLPPSEVLDCNRLFGDFQITLKKREVKEKYVISNLQLKNMVSNTWREVTHLWYLGWPERGVPTEESSLVAFLIEARSYLKAPASENVKFNEPSNCTPNSEHNPIVVHCSPGTGRTGTVIACDIAIREFELTRQVDIPKSVYQIRRNRAGAVQTKEQYAYIYRVITWYANKLTGGVLDSL